MGKAYSKKKTSLAQALMEYLIIVGIIIGALAAMRAILLRGIQATVKMAADQIGVQNDAEQKYIDKYHGYLIHSFEGSEGKREKTLREMPTGITEYIYDDEVRRGAETLVNMGFANSFM